MSFIELPAGAATALASICKSLLGRKEIPKKNLQVVVIKRAIVVELPPESGLFIVDSDGQYRSALYIMSILIWNRGTEAIMPQDIIDNKPLHIELSEAKIHMAQLASNDKQARQEVVQIQNNFIEVSFDCINPNDFLHLLIHYGGEPLTQIEVKNRVGGQTQSIYNPDWEAKAGPIERLQSFCTLMLLLNAFAVFPYCLYDVHSTFGLGILNSNVQAIPALQLLSLSFGSSILMLLASMFILNKVARANFVPGFPLSTDFEPPFYKKVIGLYKSAFQGQKQRVSNSLFSFSKPVIWNPNNPKRTKPADWIK